MIQDSLLKKTRQDEPIGIFASSTERSALLPSTERINYIKNPSFERDIQGFDISASHSLTRITSDSVFGSACGELEISTTAATSASNGGVFLPANATGRVSVVEGEDYYASVYVKNTIGSRTIELRVAGYTSATASTQITTATVTTANPTSWTRISVRYTVPATVTHIGVSIRFTTTGSTGDKFALDGLMLEKSTILNDYFDGTSYDGAWQGLPHLSSSYFSLPEGSLSYLKDDDTLYARTHRWENLATLAYPDQTNQSGKYLETDGTYYYWDSNPIPTGSWTFFNAGAGTTGWTIGNAVANWYYGQFGKLVHLRVRYAFGTTTVEGASGTLTATLPVTASANAVGTLGVGFWTDSSTSLPYKAFARITSTSTIEFSFGEDVLNNFVCRNWNTSTRPFTVANGDQLNLTILYEGA